MVTKQESMEGLCRVETEEKVWGLLRSQPSSWVANDLKAVPIPPLGLRKCYSTHTWILNFQEVLLPMVDAVLLCLPFLSP